MWTLASHFPSGCSSKIRTLFPVTFVTSPLFLIASSVHRRGCERHSLLRDQIAVVSGRGQRREQNHLWYRPPTGCIVAEFQWMGVARQPVVLLEKIKNAQTVPVPESMLGLILLRC